MTAPMDLTPAQLSALMPDERAMADAAMAATHGKWESIGRCEMDGREYHLVAVMPQCVLYAPVEVDADYAEAAQPVNILRTLAALADARAEAARLREALENTASDFECAVNYHTKPKTGMRVPWFSPWANVQTPSVLGELKRLAKQFREAVAGGGK